MPRFGCNLRKILKQNGNALPLKTTLLIGVRLLQILEKIHNTGFTYNDLKPDNIMVAYNQNQESSIGIDINSVPIFLVDFGFAQKYVDEKTG